MVPNEPMPVACAREPEDGLTEIFRNVVHPNQERVRLQCGNPAGGAVAVGVSGEGRQSPDVEEGIHREHAGNKLVAVAKSWLQALHPEGSNGTKTVVNLTVIRMPGAKTNPVLGCADTVVFERTALYGQEERGTAFPYGHDRGHVRASRPLHFGLIDHPIMCFWVVRSIGVTRRRQVALPCNPKCSQQGCSGVLKMNSGPVFASEVRTQDVDSNVAEQFVVTVESERAPVPRFALSRIREGAMRRTGNVPDSTRRHQPIRRTCGGHAWLAHSFCLRHSQGSSCPYPLAARGAVHWESRLSTRRLRPVLEVR